MFLPKNNKGIISLAAVFIVGFLGLSIVLTSSTIAVLGTNKNINTKLGGMSFYTAEAAAKEGTYQCINSFYINPSNFCLDSTNTIPFDINMASGTTTIRNLTWPYVEINGIAQNNITQREVEYLLTLFPEGLVFDYAIYSQNNLDFGGNANVNGNIFANNEIDFHGNAEVNGNAYSSGEIEEFENIHGDIHPNVQSIPAPQVDLTQYELEAQANLTFFEDANNAETYVNGNIIGNEINPEVIFVNETTGKTQIQGAGTNLTGSIVTRNDLDLTGGTYTAGENHMAIIVLGDLKIAGGTTINGVVYVSGATSFGGGNNTINGSLISAGEVNDTEVTGNTIINYDPLFIGDWIDLEGLEHTSSEPPRILGWQEM